jgi:hypothetical protein
MTERTGNILGLVVIVFMIAVHIIALRDESTIRDGLSTVNAMREMYRVGSQ